jgi:S-adenosylmethionine:tRNA ribosyltransferase-isomerase
VKTSDFDYFLPADRIAQEPRPRGSSRLLTLEPDGTTTHRSFAEFPQLLREGDVLVRNDVRVRPARLYGADREGRLTEIFLLEPAGSDARWLALARPGRRARPGKTLTFPEGISGIVEEVRPDAKRVVVFDRPLEESVLERIGHVPLPPYIRRPPGVSDRPEDRAGYQTVFAREPLAVAAPTAGLHFTPGLLDAIGARGVAIHDLTLSIGAGTFKPVTVEEVDEHAMDAEDVTIPGATAEAVLAARREGRRVVAVGTTVTRSLEAAALLPGGLSGAAGRSFRTGLFITPGFEFRAVDALLTNFHLPRSTLLMLVSAFAGRDRVLAAYEEAIRFGYLFYSYGDAMFVPARARS